ncbi:T9SS type A sorting domain-containing protein [Flavivirga rizhaonensis]|uniref:T9SS type A sorting domain-containing protein n=1 Tax=Flavivirga rizhaonensis TaxID=2559571 RepID=A0A4V3P4U2_9FLAO|nr:T9SS type A sorting domain-containing protein [Flavivirga rizhaonensis]TGV02714.1 T9SS type A sorting domain-containing protein [Flavivirga rizhaonensis]
MKKILLALSFLGILSLNAQIRIKMVDPSDNTVILRNYGGSTVDVSSYWFCNFPSYAQISGMAINSGLTNLASGEEVSITSSINFGTADAEFGLYTTNSSGFTDDMIDYLQWGSASHQRESVANAAGIWVTGTFLSVSPPFEYTGTGSENGVANWGTTLSVNDFSVNSFSLSPNPSSSILSLKFPQVINDGTLSIYNVLGETILNKKLPLNNALEIDVSNFNQGLYLVKINNQVKRFIKR